MRKMLTFKAAHIAQAIETIRPQTSKLHFDREAIRLVSPASHGSFGDEAMLLASIEILTSRGIRPEVLISGPQSTWPAENRNIYSSFDQGVSFGGFLYRESSKVIPFHTVAIGADSFDSAYGVRGVSRKIALLNSTVRAGGTAALANFSLRESRSPGAERLLRTLDSRVALWARDRVSASRAMQVFGRHVGSAPDVAAHLAPSDNFGRVDRPGVTLALVVNGHLGRLNLDGDGEVFEYFKKLTLELSKICDNLLLVAHDVRDYPNDPALVQSILNVAPTNVIGCIPNSAAEAKAILAQTTLCVTSRMHAAVATLSEGVPTVGLDYVDKFRGQFAWYGQEDEVVEIERDRINDVLLLVDDALNNLEVRRETISSAAESIKSLPVPWLKVPARGQL